MTEIVRGDSTRIDELKPLWLALREYHGSITPHWGELREEAESWERRRGVYADVLDDDGVVFLAVDEGEVVGFALCEQEEGGSPTWAWPRDFLAIVDLVVRSEYRGQGIGDALLDEVEAEARRRGVAALDVNAAAPNEAAARLYARHGYRLDLVTYRKPLD